MSKDHRSAGLRWSLLLSGGSLGGPGSSLSFICSCFVFSITSPCMACVVADIFFLWNIYRIWRLIEKTKEPCMMMMSFHLLIQIIIDFGLSFPIFLLLTSLLHLLCKTLTGLALRSFSHGGLCWSLREDNEQCTLLVVASDWYVACFCLFQHFTLLISCCSRRCCGRRFCERVNRDHWSMRRTSLLLQLWGLEIRLLHWESALLTSWAPRQKRGKKGITWWCFSLFFLDCSDRSHHHHSRYEFGLSAV